MTEAEGVAVSMWALAASWFTPTVFFCLMNLVIGTIFIASNFRSRHGEGEPPRLVRTPSLFDRVRSFDFRLYGSDPSAGPQTRYQDQSHDPDPLPPDSALPDHQQTVDQHQGQDQDLVTKSMSEVATETWASEKAVPGKTRERWREKAVDEEVDAKADDFINRFRQQLKLQRLESLLRYKDMLSRGSSN